VSPVIVVAGPTGAGKSDLALACAERFHGEIVNCDSVQLYRYLDIGAAKTPLHHRRGIPHHLIDILDPDQHFTAGDYARAARQVLAEIADRGRVPVVVGGTGFYLRALLDGLPEGPQRDVHLRERLSRRKAGSLHRLLSRFDPPAAARIHPNDTNKLIRAVEICLLTRGRMSEWFANRVSQSLSGFRVIKVLVDPPREQLAAALDRRCLHMIQSGLIDEVRHILSLGYSPDCKALTSIGYRETVLHLHGLLSLDDAVARMQISTRQYAKRQRTWFRREREFYAIHDFGNRESAITGAIHHIEAAVGSLLDAG
jgi:tRNA dimethylallyltransferase